MEFGQLFYILKARRWLLVLSVLVVLGVALAYRFVAPGNYRAVASVIVDPRGINPVSGVATQEPMAQSAVLGTYANIARSEGIARQVLQQLPAASTDRLKALWLRSHEPNEAGFDAWAARRLMKEVDVRAGGQASNVLDITVTHRDNREAAAIANTYAAAMMRYAQDMRTSSARRDAEYFRGQALAFKRDTEEAEQRLASFQRQNGITSVDDRMDVETSRLAALSSQAIVNQDLSYESSSRARQGAGSSVSTELVNNTLVQSLSADLARKEARVRELSARLGVNHPDMQTANEQVVEARSALARESRNVAASLNSNSAAARSRAAALRGDSEQQRQKVIELNALRVEMSSLDKDVLQKRKLYEAALQRSAETGLEAGSQRADLQLLTEAFPPEDRAGPGASVLLPLATLVGLLVGILLSIGLDRLRPRIYRPVDLEAMGVQVLQVVPRVRFGAPPPNSRALSLQST
ncbi:GumC family protein [Variovorax sp. LT1P1]|uniref:GumC family protein n=1 Tax=Variovorax sp. LT1P1 TaxID=3443730 RepID=UPI003F44C344